MDLVLRDLRIIMGGANARPAKHVVEQSKAVKAAAQYLQGYGFTDPMVLRKRSPIEL